MIRVFCTGQFSCIDRPRQIAKPVLPRIYPRQLIPANISTPASINRTVADGHRVCVCILPIANAVIALVIVDVTSVEPADPVNYAAIRASLDFGLRQSFSVVYETREPSYPARLRSIKVGVICTIEFYNVDLEPCQPFCSHPSVNRPSTAALR